MDQTEALQIAVMIGIENSLTVRKADPNDPGYYFYENASWEQLMREYGSENHSKLKSELLAKAKKWTPKGWDEGQWDNKVSYSGSFKFITLEVQLENGKPAAWMSEVD